MPTVLLAEGYRFFFFSNENDEPPHVHVRKGSSAAKTWLEPVQIAYSYGFSPAEQRRIRELVAEHLTTFLERWHEHLRR